MRLDEKRRITRILIVWAIWVAVLVLAAWSFAPLL
jgi:hypothetical protein